MLEFILCGRGSLSRILLPVMDIYIFNYLLETFLNEGIQVLIDVLYVKIVRDTHRRDDAVLLR